MKLLYFKNYNLDAVKMRKEIEALESKWLSMGGEVSASEVAKMDQLAAQIKTKKQQYCATYSPKYKVLVNEYLAHVKKTLPEYNQFEELQDKQMQLTAGTSSPLGEKGLMGLEAVADCPNFLKEIFKYDLLKND